MEPEKQIYEFVNKFEKMEMLCRENHRRDKKNQVIFRITTGKYGTEITLYKNSFTDAFKHKPVREKLAYMAVIATFS